MLKTIFQKKKELTMKKKRRFMAVMIFLTLCMTGIAAYDADFPEFIIGGELIANVPVENFLPVAADYDSWYSFMASSIGQNPDVFYQITNDNMDQSDYYAIRNLQSYIEESTDVNDNDVYAFVLARQIENGNVPDGWLIMSHFSEPKDTWTHIAYYFGVEF